MISVGQKGPADNQAPAGWTEFQRADRTLFGCGSAAVSRLLLYFILGLICSATCAVLCSRSAAVSGFLLYFFLYSATCAVLVRSSSAAGCCASGKSQAACTDEAGNTQTGKEFFQILAFHGFPPVVEEAVF